MVINISQFGICESRNDLSHLGGIKLENSNPNYGLIKHVMYKCSKYVDRDYIWLFDCYDERIDFLLNKDPGKDYLIEELIDIYDMSNWMIFWYSSDYDDLTLLNGKDELISYFNKTLCQQPIELYFKISK